MNLISIIVPIYNVETYLEKCLESLINQTLKDIEIILVNDGSTDKCGEICNKYADKDSRIKVIHKSNGGLSDARNVGIKSASSEYIAFLDSDDWVEETLYEKLYYIKEKYEADIVQCEFIKAYNEKMKIEKFDNKIEIYSGIEALALIYKNKYLENTVVWNKIYKKRLFEGIEFPKGKLHEDEFTTYKIIHKANKFVHINSKLIYYRQRENSIIGQGISRKSLDGLEALIARGEYFKENNIVYLIPKNDAKICDLLIGLYIKIIKSELQERKELMKIVKSHMLQNFFAHIANKEIKLSKKFILTLAIINKNLLIKLHEIKLG